MLWLVQSMTVSFNYLFNGFAEIFSCQRKISHFVLSGNNTFIILNTCKSSIILYHRLVDLGVIFVVMLEQKMEFHPYLFKLDIKDVPIEGKTACCVNNYLAWKFCSREPEMIKNTMINCFMRYTHFPFPSWDGWLC